MNRTLSDYLFSSDFCLLAIATAALLGGIVSLYRLNKQGKTP